MQFVRLGCHRSRCFLLPSMRRHISRYCSAAHLSRYCQVQQQSHLSRYCQVQQQFISVATAHRVHTVQSSWPSPSVSPLSPAGLSLPSVPPPSRPSGPVWPGVPGPAPSRVPRAVRCAGPPTSELVVAAHVPRQRRPAPLWRQAAHVAVAQPVGAVRRARQSAARRRRRRPVSTWRAAAGRRRHVAALRAVRALRERRVASVARPEVVVAAVGRRQRRGVHGRQRRRQEGRVAAGRRGRRRRGQERVQRRRRRGQERCREQGVRQRVHLRARRYRASAVRVES